MSSQLSMCTAIQQTKSMTKVSVFFLFVLLYGRKSTLEGNVPLPRCVCCTGIQHWRSLSGLWEVAEDCLVLMNFVIQKSSCFFGGGFFSFFFFGNLSHPLNRYFIRYSSVWESPIQELYQTFWTKIIIIICLWVWLYFLSKCITLPFVFKYRFLVKQQMIDANVSMSMTCWIVC